MRGLLIALIMASCSAAASAQPVEYLTPGDILRRDIAAFFNAKNDFTRSIAQINTEFEAAKKELADAEPGTPAHAKAQEKLDKLELGKNLNLLALYMPYGVAGDSNMAMKIPEMLGGAKLAGGVLDEAEPAFFSWVRAIRSSLGKSDGEILILDDSPANVDRLMAALLENQDTYAQYLKAARTAQSNEDDRYQLALYRQKSLERAKLPAGAIALSRSRIVPFIESGIATYLYSGKARDLVLQEDKRGQKVLHCMYGPTQNSGSNQVVFEHQYFWYETTAASHDAMAKLDTSGAMAHLPRQAATECPSTNKGSGPPQKDDYPSGPLRVIIPSGGLVAGNALFAQASEVLGQVFVVDRSIRHGFAYSAEAPSDGYTLFLCSFQCATNNLLNRSMAGNITDLEPVMLIGMDTDVLVVSPALKVDSLTALIALAKEKPGSLRMASSGNGTPTHLAGAYFNDKAQIEAMHKPYRDLQTALLRVSKGTAADYMIVSASQAMPYLADNRLKAIGTSSPLHEAVFDNVPTMKDAGLPAYSATGWTMVLVPAGTSKEHINQLNEAFNKAIKDPDVITRLTEIAVVPAGGSAQDAGDFLSQQITQWESLIDKQKLSAK